MASKAHSRNVAKTVVLSVAISAFLSGCTPPPGYKHDDKSWWPLATVWAPGSIDPKHPHVHAGDQEHTWLPDAGYTFAKEGDLATVWTPGSPDPQNPHTHAGEKEGIWSADPGYEWLNADENDHRVKWSPYMLHPNHKNIISYKDEGYWMAWPGYKFKESGVEIVPSSANLEVVWNPGVIHPSCPVLQADVEERSWHPTDGYVVTNNDKDDIYIVRSAAAQEQDKQDRANRVIGDVLIALFAGAISQPKEGDSQFTSAIKHGAGEVAMHTTVDALGTAFSEYKPGEFHCNLGSKDWTRPLSRLP